MKKLYLLLMVMLCFSIAKAQVVYEDFEEGGKLAWNGLDGTYNGIVPNPAVDGLNASANVGSYTKSGDDRPYSLLLAQLETPMDLSENNQFKIMVYSEVADVPMILKLENADNTNNIERSQIIPVANEWVELTFDFSEKAASDDFIKVIMFFDAGNATSVNTYLFDNLIAAPMPPARVFDDFEENRNITYTFVQGTFDQAAANPAPGGVNISDIVGMYTKNPEEQFSFLVGTIAEGVNLAVYNQLKIDVYSTVATDISLKLEGGTEPTQTPDNTQPITVLNEWVTYTFDLSEFSDASFASINIFFDKENATSDVYYLDNIRAEPIPTALVFEDFEENRNITYTFVQGTFDQAAANPATNEVNNSPIVGMYTKNPAEQFSFLVGSVAGGIDLATYNQIIIDVYATVATDISLKLEGGPPETGATPDNTQPITTVNEWVTYTFNLSSFSDVDFERINIFFDKENATSDVYYIDNIRAERPENLAGLLEDFENGGQLAWRSLDDSYNGIVANPETEGINSSANVGSFTKSSGFSSTPLLATLPASLDLSSDNLLRMMVYSQNATAVKLRLEGSETEVPYEVQQSIPATERWVMLGFDLGEVAEVSDFNKLVLVFNPEIDATNDVYLFDNIELVNNPCLNVEANPDVIDDFNCQRNTNIVVGTDRLTVVENPDPTGINTSDLVGQYVDPLDEFSALVYEFPEAIDLTGRNIISAKIWAPKAGNIVFKLEGGEDAPIELVQEITEAGQWMEYTFDFIESIGSDHDRLTIFFNFAVLAEEGDIYYIDDIQFNAPPLEAGIIEDFEDGGRLTWVALDGAFNGIVGNPKVDGNNPSANVGSYTKSMGRFSPLLATLPGPVDFSQSTAFKMQVYSTVANVDVLFKLENQDNTNNIEVSQPVSVANEWVELEFDMSAAADATDLVKIVLFFDSGEDGEGRSGTYFFDNISQGGEIGVVTGTNEIIANTLNIYPNPASGILHVNLPYDVAYHNAVIYDYSGKQIMETLINGSGQSVSINIQHLNQGIYFLKLSNNEQLVQSKFIVK